MDDVFSKLKDLKSKIVVIRSTVIPGTTENYQQKYPNLKVLFNPEFLTDATANKDYAKPDKQIIGYTTASQGAAAQEVLDLLPDAPYKKAMPAKEAEMVKYMVNSYYATKVTFANQIYDICQAAGIDYETVKEGFKADKRVIDSHLEIFHKGYRGFGGKCLRKDLYSLIDFAKKKGAEPKLLEAAKEINLNLNDGK
jgi:UDPglucose 6-dehydrogenase